MQMSMPSGIKSCGIRKIDATQNSSVSPVSECKFWLQIGFRPYI